MSNFVRCTHCGEVVEATEPCCCLFLGIGTLDDQGVFHTAVRVPVVSADSDRPFETVEQQVRRGILDTAKGKDVSRIFR